MTSPPASGSSRDVDTDPGGAPDRRPMDRPIRLLLGLAGLWSAGLVAAAFFIPSYSSISVVVSHPAGPSGLPSTHLVSSTGTLVDVNGLKALAPVGLPLVAVALVAFVLWRRHRKRQSGAGPIAWSAVVLVGVLTLLGILTIGPYLVPVGVLLGAACARASGNSTGWS